MLLLFCCPCLEEDGVPAAPSPFPYNLANSDPMKAASKSQGPKRWRREEHLGLAGEGSGVGWSGRVPVTAESTNAEAEAMKLGPMEGGRELEAVDGPEAADADLLRLIRWDARGKPK